MKVLIDTNVLVSAALNPGGIAAKAYFKATEKPYECVLCDYCIDELNRVFKDKMPKYIKHLESFLASALLAVKIVYAPTDENAVDEEISIRDIKDRPIIRAAITSAVDIILTGDKDFLESGILTPKMVAPADFLCYH